MIYDIQKRSGRVLRRLGLVAAVSACQATIPPGPGESPDVQGAGDAERDARLIFADRTATTDGARSEDRGPTGDLDSASDGASDGAPDPGDAPSAMADARPDLADSIDGRLSDLGAGLCAPCDDNAVCASLGAGSECSMLFGGRFCTSACAADGPDACPPGYRCGFGRCIPAGARCDGCATAPCDLDQRCNLDNGMCEARSGRCGGCASEADCEEGFLCSALPIGQACLSICGADTPCPATFTCRDGACQPDAGFCDACGGCLAPTPICNVLTRVCQACGGGQPCPLGRVCDERNACVEPPAGVDCLSGLDCREAEAPHCEAGACVSCRADADCRVGQRCELSACVDAPCAAFACQSGSVCAVGDGGAVCGPGCADDAACLAPELRCNVSTGQCFQRDQRCDPDGLVAVCAPGAACIDDPTDARRTLCTCARANPTDFIEPNEAHRIPCQPGGYCLQLGNDPGVCIASR